MPTKLHQRRIASDAMWVAISQVGCIAGMVVGVRLLTEVTPPGVFGRVSLLVGAVALTLDILFKPVFEAVTRFLPELAVAGEGWRLRRVAARFIRRVIAAVAGLIVAAGIVAAAWLGYRAITVALILAVFAWLTVWKLLERELYGAARRQRAAAVWYLGEGWLRPMAAVGMVLLCGATEEAILAGYSVWMVVLLGAFALFGRAEAGEPPTDDDGDRDRALGRRLWHYALPLAPTAACGWFLGAGDRYFIAGLRGSADLGVYIANYGIVMQMYWASYMLLQRTLRPVYYQAIARNESTRARRILRAWLGLVVGGGLAGVVLVTLTARWIASVALASEYRSGAALMPWLAVAYLVYCTSAVLQQPLYAAHRTRPILVARLGATIAAVATIPIFVSQWQLLGAAWACIAYFAVELLMLLAFLPCTRRRSAEPSSS